MLTITAILRAKPGSEDAVRTALLAMADHAAANEPATVGYFVSQDTSHPGVFTTYERYADRAAMDRHNGSEALKRFFAAVETHLDGDVTVITATEIASKGLGVSA